MKTKLKVYSKRTLSVFLSVLMLISCMSIGMISANAGFYWEGGDYRVISDFANNSWSTTSNYLSTTENNKAYTTYVYLKKGEADLYFRFCGRYDNNTTYKQVQPDNNNNDLDVTNQSVNNWKEGSSKAYYIDTDNAAFADSSKYYRITVGINMSTGYVWANGFTALTNLTPTISASPTSFTVGNSTTLTGGYSGDKVGTVKYNYQYSTNNSTWTTLNSTAQTGTYSWTPSSVGTYYVRVKATDTGITKDTNARSTRSYYSSSQQITVRSNETYYSVTRKYQINGGTVTNESTNSPVDVGSQTGTTVSFDLFKTYNNVRYKLTGFNSNGVNISSSSTSTGQVVCTASSNSAYITALYAQEADFKQFYFKKPASGWGSTLYAYVWDVSTVNSSSGTVQNHEWPGVALVNGAYQAASGARSDSYGVCDYVGSISVQNGSTADTYYYYKTYYTDYDTVIFNDNSNQTGDLTIPSSNSKYNNGTTNNWYDVPAAVYSVSVSAADTSPTFVNATGSGTATGTLSGDVSGTSGTVNVNATTSKTVTVNPPAGYQIDTSNPWTKTSNVTLTKTSLSTSSMTYTVTATATGQSISPNFKEISRTITVYRRLYNTAGTQQGSNTQITTCTAGISSYATITQPDETSGDYSWNKYTLGSGVQANPTSTNLNTRAALKVNGKTSGTYAVYEDYKETLYTMTINRNNTAYGVVKKNNTGSGLTSTSIGNVTYISLTAVNNAGYDFDFWEVQPGSSGTVTVYDGTNTQAITAATSSSSASYTILTNATLQFKMNKDSTVVAHFKPVAYSISAAFPSGNGYASGNSIATTNTSGAAKGSGEIGDAFQIRVTLVDGYDVDSSGITFATGTGYATPTAGTVTTSGSVKIFNFTLGAGSAAATVSLKAKAVASPTVKLWQKTADRTFSYKTMSDNGYVDEFYRQQVKIQAGIASYDSETATFVIKNGSTTINTVSGKKASEMTSSSPLEISPPAAMRGPALTDPSDGYVQYSLVMTVTNAPAGVTAATLTKTYYIRVYYNTAQQQFHKIWNLYYNTVDETAATAATYYKDGAPWSAFNEGRTTISSTYLAFTDSAPAAASWPAYNATAAVTTTISTNYTNFYNAYSALQDYAKLSTVYVLVKSTYANADSTRVSIYSTTNGTAADWNHYKAYHFKLANSYIKSQNVVDHHKMRYEGKAGSTYYLYSFTCASKAKVQIYVTNDSSANDMTVTGNTLTGTVTSMTTIEKDYYINAYNKTKGNTAITSAADYVDLENYRSSSAKTILEVSNTEYTGTSTNSIKTLLGIDTRGSLIGSSPAISANVTAFMIQKDPKVALNESNSTTYVNLTNNSNKWKAEKSGKYKVIYRTKYTNGVDADDSTGATFEHTGIFYIYVALDEVNVYVDMNDNVGTPTLNFSYTSGSSTKTLPYDMSLVNGSESIYKYTVKLSKLQEYGINYKSGNTMIPITIASISVDGKKYYSNPPTNTAGFTIKTDAYVFGSIWFKANSNPLTTFDNIAIASVKTTFRAVNESGVHLKDGVTNVTGTGIITEATATLSDNSTKYIDGIYEVSYAAYDANADTSAGGIKYNFGYNVRAHAAPELTSGGTVYYFDRWVKMQSPEEVAVNSSGDPTAVSLTGATATGNEKADYNINSMPQYNEGNGDYTYYAVYKAAATGSARVEITYKFQDYNTEDGNYVYDENKPTVDASYTKTVKIPLGSVYQGNTYSNTYSNYAAVVSDAQRIVRDSMPDVNSNYYNYTYPTATNPATQISTDSTNRKLKMEVTLDQSARDYKIVVVKGSTYYRSGAKTGKYQQTVELKASDYGLSGANVRWYVKNGTTEMNVGTGATYTARFVQSGFTTDSSAGDTIYIYVASQSSPTVDLTSSIINSYTETFKDGETDRVRHNFYIVDYLNSSSGTLVGAGTLVATATNGTYNQTNAETVLGGNLAAKQTYINNALNGDYTTERQQQTINNISFRYIPYNSTYGKETLRYSEQLKGYHYIYGVQNNISDSYANQTIRVFSYFIYENGGTKTVVVSPTYAEVSRNP